MKTKQDDTIDKYPEAKCPYCEEYSTMEHDFGDMQHRICKNDHSFLFVKKLESKEESINCDIETEVTSIIEENISEVAIVEAPVERIKMIYKYGARRAVRI